MTAAANQSFAIQRISPKLRKDEEVTLSWTAKEPDLINVPGKTSNVIMKP